jgi:tetratricopeptide (TPR) repeat protein
MGRITGEDVDDPAELSAGEREAVAREALAALREALKRDRTIPGLYTRIGAIYDLLQQPEDAVLALEEAVRQDAGDAEAHYALGSLLLGQRQPERAVGPLETAVQLAPYALAYRLNLAACYGALGRETEAKRELDMVDRIQPGLPQVAELRATLARGGRKR